MIGTRNFFKGTTPEPFKLVRLSIPVASGKINEVMDLFLNMNFKGWDTIEFYETQDALPNPNQPVCQLEINALDPLTLQEEVNKWAIGQGYFTSTDNSKRRLRFRIPQLMGIELEFVQVK